ncbi:unnamed protein product [Psylliodes chrysocephalus]|uniref:Vacuolar protein-sorting-associated protein 25 n=1 Tax=Psylliodes chrysocephalus TaxID=3402493 RepID=A0A9P0CHP6_9CUCU|nr:unnamed protein product [Psylliodes chrysocephala]
MPEVEIDWPWQYNFPPFYTLQQHPETRSKQVAAWKSLILNYCEKTKNYTIDVRDTNQCPLFNNSTINRKLEPDIIISILGELQRTGNAAPVDKAKNRWEIYWHTLEEWATIVYDFINERGMQNTVVTLYELTQGEDSIDTTFYGMNQDVLIKVLRVLEGDRKCELILEDDIQGAKFF